MSTGTAQYEQLLGLSSISRSVTRKQFGAQSSIATVRVLTRAARAFGMIARPVPVRCYIANPNLTDRIHQIGHFPDAVDTSNGEFATLIDHDRSMPGTRSGHLVAVIDETWLVDAALDQVNMPAHDVDLGPLIVPISARWGTGRDDVIAVDLNDCGVFYTAMPDARRYRSSPAWCDSTQTKHLIRQVVTAMEQEYVDGRQ